MSVQFSFLSGISDEIILNPRSGARCQRGYKRQLFVKVYGPSREDPQSCPWFFCGNHGNNDTDDGPRGPRNDDVKNLKAKTRPG